MLATLALVFLGPKTYQFDCQYIASSITGEIQNRQLIHGALSLKSDHEATWSGVTLAGGQAEQDFAKPEDQAYMNGFAYDPTDSAAAMKPEFFKGFPETAMQAKNLVWDSEMFFMFAARSKDTKLGEPLHFGSGDVDLAGSGTFTNKNVELTRLGSAQNKGVPCDVIKYDAFFNSVKIQMTGGVSLTGRSHYWGEFYVRIGTSEFQSGTLYEDVLGDLTLPAGQHQTINVFREGTFGLVQ